MGGMLGMIGQHTPKNYPKTAAELWGEGPEEQTAEQMFNALLGMVGSTKSED